MKPKDLKNSEELKSTKKIDLKNSEINAVSEDLKNEEKEPQTEKEITEEPAEKNKEVKDEVVESAEDVDVVSDEVEEEAEVPVTKLVDEKKVKQEVTETVEKVVSESKKTVKVKTGLEKTKESKGTTEVEDEAKHKDKGVPEAGGSEDNIETTVKEVKTEKKEVEAVAGSAESKEDKGMQEAIESKDKIETTLEEIPAKKTKKKVAGTVADPTESEVELKEDNKGVQELIEPEEKIKTTAEKVEAKKGEEKAVESVADPADPKDKKQEKGEQVEVISRKEEKPKVIKKAPEVIKQEPAEKKEVIDYSTYSQVELVNAMRDVLDNNGDHNIKEEIEVIKSVFYKNLNENIELAKKKFIEEGGTEEDFKAEEDPYENDIKDLLRRYRQIRIEYNKKLESEKEDNLKLKYEVIEKIKGLINNEESINKTFNDFRELQRQWHDIGLVPQSKMKNLWDTYHFHVENFYDYIKINRELRDLDLRKNLEIKIKLCENAEELLVEPSIIKAFNTLQKYHERWREVGPVPREQKDDIWERFKAATSKINKKHQEFFESRKEEQKKNLEAKTALCEKVEEIDISLISNYKEWDEKSKELVKLQKVWRTIGFAPKKDNNKIYERFRSACDNFFNAKREFYAKNKELQQNNLQQKIDLCIQAESLKDSTDWKKTTQDFINIQRKWKEIGPIPRKHSDSVWKRFRAACDYFFEKKSGHFSGMDSEQVDNLKKKEELIEKVINFKSSEDVDENLNTLKGFQREWTEIGHVPFKKKDEVQHKFREAINKLYDELNIDEEKRNILKFRSKMSSYSESNRGQNKMRMERDKYMNKLKQLESDHVLLENNIGFFAKSKNAESLIADVKKKIEVSKQKIEFLKEKIRVIDEMDSE